MKVVEIAFTGYAVTDMGRARRFYEGALGLVPARTFADEKFAWTEYDIGPGTLALGSGLPHCEPSRNGGSVALEVADFEAAIGEIRAGGHPILAGPVETPVCFLAVVADPDGNAVTLHHRKA